MLFVIIAFQLLNFTILSSAAVIGEISLELEDIPATNRKESHPFPNYGFLSAAAESFSSGSNGEIGPFNVTAIFESWRNKDILRFTDLFDDKGSTTKASRTFFNDLKLLSEGETGEDEDVSSAAGSDKLLSASLDRILGCGFPVRIPYSKATKKEVKKFKPLFEQLIRDTWFHKEHVQTMISENQGYSRVLQTMDQVIPEIYLTCLKEKFNFISSEIVNKSSIHRLEYDIENINSKRIEEIGAVSKLPLCYAPLRKMDDISIRDQKHLVFVNHVFEFDMSLDETKDTGPGNTKTITIGFSTTLAYLGTGSKVMTFGLGTYLGTPMIDGHTMGELGTAQEDPQVLFKQYKAISSCVTDTMDTLVGADNHIDGMFVKYILL